MNRNATLFIALAMPFALTACRKAPDAAAVPTTMPAPAESTAVVVAPDVAATAPAGAPAGGKSIGALSGQDFIAHAADLAGTVVTLSKCSLQNTPISSGEYACRVIDEAGNDLKTADGLPVDVFLPGADLDQAAKDFIANSCTETFCTVQLTGKLAVSEATFYLSMTEVALAPAQ